MSINVYVCTIRRGGSDYKFARIFNGDCASWGIASWANGASSVLGDRLATSSTSLRSRADVIRGCPARGPYGSPGGREDETAWCQ